MRNMANECSSGGADNVDASRGINVFFVSSRVILCGILLLVHFIGYLVLFGCCLAYLLIT